MATVAEFTVPGDSFPLGTIFEGYPEVTVELDRVVPTNDAMFPYFWVRGVPADEVTTALSKRREIASVSLVDELADQSLFRADWQPSVDGLLEAITTADVTLLSATGTTGTWHFELRADDPGDVSAFQEYCHEQGIELSLQRIHDLPGTDAIPEYGLTPGQREALLLAFEAGYYDDPRRATLEELAGDLDITRQSMSARLRRGYRNLLANTVVATSTLD